MIWCPLLRAYLRSVLFQVYIDLGANWANTLRLFKDIPWRQGHQYSGPWEVYAFEASPLIQPFVERFTRYLNGAQDRPPLTVRGAALKFSF